MLRRFNVWIVLLCAFAVEERPKGLRECPPAGLAPHWTPLRVLSFFFMLVLTLDLPEIGTIGVGTKFANLQISSLNI